MTILLKYWSFSLSYKLCQLHYAEYSWPHNE